MPSHPQNTTVPSYAVPPPTDGAATLSKGQAQATHSGFMEGELPDETKLWEDYYNNVLRGDKDSLAPLDEFVKSDSMTFSENNPPYIHPDFIGDGPATDFLGGAGAPFGGMSPTWGSPGEGNGLDYESIPAFDLMYPLGDGTNGSISCPDKTSDYQSTQSDSGTGEHPNYMMGQWSPAEEG